MPPAATAETFLLSCIDPRLVDDTTFHFAALGRTDRYSEMRIAGAALALVDPARPAWAMAVWENLDASRRMHGVRRVTLLNHQDCGALKAWAGRPLTPAEEDRLQQQVLDQAAAAVRARHPDMQVELRLMALDGSVRHMPCTACVLPPAAAAATDPAGFAELVRLRRRDPAGREPAAELALLSEGVTRFGLSAAEARQALGPESGHGAARDVAAFLRSRADRSGRIGREDLAQAGQLHRRLTGLPAVEATRRAAAVAEAEGLAPRPEGIRPFRSDRWFRAAQA